MRSRRGNNMSVVLCQTSVLANHLKQINGLGELNIGDMSVDENSISLCAPIEINNKLIKEYVDKVQEQFKADYPETKFSHIETSILLCLTSSKAAIELLVTFYDKDEAILDVYDVFSRYGIELNHNAELEIKRILWEQFTKMMFGVEGVT